MKRALNCFKYVWALKEKDINCFMNWNVAIKSQKYVCGSQKCDLCNCEKLFISRADQNVLRNKCGDLVSNFQHGIKFNLKCCKDR